jgi:hypothetical protein
MYAGVNSAVHIWAVLPTYRAHPGLGQQIRRKMIEKRIVVRLISTFCPWSVLRYIFSCAIS